METSGGGGGGNGGDSYRSSSSSGNVNISNTADPTSRRYLTAANFIRYPISALLEYSGILRIPTRSSHQETEGLINGFRDDSASASASPATAGGGEVSIRIIGAGEQDLVRIGGGAAAASSLPASVPSSPVTSEGVSLSSSPSSPNPGVDGDTNDAMGANARDSSYQRYDIQQVARWIEQILPFSLLLLVVFIRQHLQGFFVTIWVAAVMFKSNDVLKKQTALKGERKMSVLVGIAIIFMLHVVGVYWWYQNDDLLYPLVMLPPKAIPPFWHAIFTIMVNDTMVRQTAMVLKCILLMYYKNSRGRNYRKQGQMLTLVEYMLLLYRALLPAPVWYRFFLNKEYGSLFSSLTTGLYLTFKLTSVVEKVQSFFAALKALSRKEVHYGSYATSEQDRLGTNRCHLRPSLFRTLFQLADCLPFNKDLFDFVVNSAGDLCAICQEKMHAPILLRCKHIFCEDCVSEWFERERTCPLCRALVKPADLKSFGDGSTSLFFQLF